MGPEAADKFALGLCPGIPPAKMMSAKIVNTAFAPLTSGIHFALLIGHCFQQVSEGGLEVLLPNTPQRLTTVKAPFMKTRNFQKVGIKSLFPCDESSSKEPQQDRNYNADKDHGRNGEVDFQIRLIDDDVPREAA